MPVISFPGKIIQALSITFFNSRTLPGQLCLQSAVIASGVKIGFIVSSTLRFVKRVFCKLGMSVLLSANEGTLIGKTLILKNKSALNSPLSTFFSRSLCVAQINLRSILISSAPPTLCMVLLSIARKSLA